MATGDDRDRLTGTLAGRYVIERELGRGGMATVYLARDLKHRRAVAVKVLNADVAAAVGPERFLREIEIAAGLSHPHIVPLYDSGRDGRTVFYVMPFVEGESLQDRLRRERQLAVGEAIEIGRQVADALAHAHARGIVHRDIKPGNIMLVANHALIADFGVAMVTQAATPERMTSSGVALGTPLYMSPEQATGEAPIDARSDLYSLGSVLYEMLTGEPPFTGATPNVILARKLTGSPPSIRLIRDTVPEWLERITFKTLAKAPADRFRTAAELAGALAGASIEDRQERGSEPAGGEPQTPLPHRGGPARSPMTLVQGLALAGGALLLVSTLAGFLTTTVYDLALRVPYQFTPSRLDFPVVGIRALIPSLYTAFVIAVAYVIAKQVVRVLGVALRRSPVVRDTVDRWTDRASQGFERLWYRPPGGVPGEVWFALAIVASAAVLGTFVAIARAAPAANGGIFACEYREVHKSYTVAMTGLILLLAVSWHRVFRDLAIRRPAGAARSALPRWGGIALIVGLLLTLTAPWRLLWTETPRARLDGERYYVIGEPDGNLLLYNPRTRITELRRSEDLPQLQRLPTAGYIFEGEEAFESPISGC